MLSATFIRFFLFTCFTFTTLVLAKDDFSKRGLAYGNWSKSDVDIWDAQKSPLTWYYNVSLSYLNKCQGYVYSQNINRRLRLRLM